MVDRLSRMVSQEPEPIPGQSGNDGLAQEEVEQRNAFLFRWRVIDGADTCQFSILRLAFNKLVFKSFAKSVDQLSRNLVNQVFAFCCICRGGAPLAVFAAWLKSPQ